MADKKMKILVIGGNSYEIVDEKARADIETLKDANTIDTTLSQSGQAADAKAVGDAIKQIDSNKANINYVNEQLNLKVPKSRTINGKSLDEDIVLKPEDVGVITDATLKEEGCAADAKAVGDAINNVSSKIETDINAFSSEVDSKINQLSANIENDINQLSNEVNQIISVPTSTTEDNGKFLRVVDGSASWQTVQNAEEVSF